MKHIEPGVDRNGEVLALCGQCRWWSEDGRSKEFDCPQGLCHVGGPSRDQQPWPHTLMDDWCALWSRRRGLA